MQPRDMRAQLLDDMDLERERGITIKAHAVTIWHEYEGERYQLNLIDTPGHVDFNYEVEKSLQACEGALLLVDASQGVEAQTVANAYLAIEAELEIIPVLNKTDLPHARPEEICEEIEHSIGIDATEALHVSAKTGVGVKEVLDAIVEKIPPPGEDPTAPLRALTFDAVYDEFRGIIATRYAFAASPWSPVRPARYAFQLTSSIARSPSPFPAANERAVVRWSRASSHAPRSTSIHMRS